jgi:hypothetical protein
LTLVLQIVVVLVILVGLITIIMSIKNWHWAQMLLVLSLFFTSIGVLVLGLEVFRIHRNLRKGMPALEKKIADVQAESAALERGTRDEALMNRIFAEGLPFDAEAEGNRMPAMDVWKQRLQVQARERGRVWSGVKPAGRVDAATGQIPVAIPAPRPHGLEKDAIVYAFEQGPPNPAAPDQPAQYLGEFRVMEVRDDGVTLKSVQGLDNRTGGRLDRSAANPGSVWKLYETMPLDSYELFAGLNEAQLKQLLPAESIPEYLRQGTPATPDDDEYHRAGFDDKGLRVGPDDAANATEWRFDRPLRDYAYLFAELARQRVVMLAQRAGLVEDNNRLKAAEASAQKLKAHREQEIVALKADLGHMTRDRQVIERLLAAVEQQLGSARKMVGDLMNENAELAQKLVASQLAQLRSITAATPAPGVSPAVSPAVLGNSR